MRATRPAVFSATASVFPTILMLAFAAAPAPAVAAGAPPFCVLRGGSDGPGSSPQVCAYFDYQACLQAAADMRGNCVQNIDYRGEVSSAPAARQSRRVR